MTEDKRVTADNIDEFFDALHEQAAETDQLSIQLNNERKELVKTFNKRRFRVRKDSIAMTYIQGIPSEDFVSRYEAGVELGKKDLLADLVEQNRFKLKSYPIAADDQIEKYYNACVSGLFGATFLAEVFGNAEEAKLGFLFRTPLNTREAEEAKASFTGALFKSGLDDYWNSFKGLIKELQGEEGLGATCVLYPPSKISAFAKSAVAFAEFHGMETISEDDL